MSAPITEIPIYVESVFYKNGVTFADAVNDITARNPLYPQEVWIDIESIPPNPPVRTPYPGTEFGIVTGISDVVLSQVGDNPYQYDAANFLNCVPATFMNGAYQPTLTDATGRVVPYNVSVWIVDNVRNIVEFQFLTPQQLRLTLPLTIAYWQYNGTFASSGGSGGSSLWKKIEDYMVPGQVDLKLADPGPNITVLFPLGSTEYASGTESKFFLDGGNGALRAGSVTGSSWNVDNRGESSVAFGRDNLAQTQFGGALCGNNNAVTTNIPGRNIGSTIVTGSNNQISAIEDAADSSYSVIIGGSNNNIGLGTVVASNNSIIGGGASNQIGSTTNSNAISSGIFVGFGNSIGTGASTSYLSSMAGACIAAGSGNKISFGDSTRSDMSFIGGGASNVICNGNTSSAQMSFIGSGISNIVANTTGSNCDHSAIVAGQSNVINGNKSFIGTGNANQIEPGSQNCGVLSGDTNNAGGLNSSILGGLNNIVTLMSSQSSVVAGSGNSVTGVNAAIVAGSGNIIGDSNSCVIAGYSNSVESGGSNSAIIGGNNNIIKGQESFIGCGNTNLINLGCVRGTIVNGVSNSITGTSTNCSILCGSNNQITGGGTYNTIIGGTGNAINTSGNGSVAMGTASQVAHSAAFVWNDGAENLSSTGNNSFTVGATGGTTFYTTSDHLIGASLAPGASAWAAVSDRNVKENLRELDYGEVLTRVCDLPIYEYNYQGQAAEQLCRGPTAQDWHAAFPSAKDPLRIDTMDLDGITLAAVRGLVERLQKAEARIIALENNKRKK